MKKFLVLYNMPAEGFEHFKNASEEDRKKEMDEWMKWMEEKKDSFVDAGNPVGTNHRVTKDGASQVSNEVGGYSIIQAESHEDACALCAENPHFGAPGAYIEVMEIVEM